MPVADFNKKLNLPSKGGQYIRLKEKGDKVKFIIANTPHYETIHFINREVVVCGKYNSDDGKGDCEYCDMYKKAIEDGDETKERNLRPVTNFYYPILDLTNNKPAIFQFSAKSIHYTVKNYADEGVDVFNSIWSVERTNEQGANYYKVLCLGSPKLTKEQEEQLALAKKLEIKARESASVSVAEPTEEVNLDDVNLDELNLDEIDGELPKA